MLRFEMTFEEEFSDIYNRYNNNDTGKKYLSILGISREKMDIVENSKLYFANTVEDKSIDINANVGRKISPNNYATEVVKSQLKLNGLYLIWDQLKNLFGPEDAKMCIDSLITGDVYMHDMTGPGVQIPYCFAWSSSNIFSGRKYGQLQSKPPKRSDSFIACVVESLFDITSGDLMGAIAIPDFLINLSYFYKKENINPFSSDHKDKILQDIQRFIHSINQQFRTGGQSMFSNISIMDRPTMTETFSEARWPDMSEIDFEYVQLIQEIFVEFMAKGDPLSGLPYRFPVTTMNIFTDENQNIVDQKFLDMVCKHNTRGIFNIFICHGKAKLASCCRLLSDPKQLMEYSRFDSFANSGVSLGSARVVTINLARIGKDSNLSEEKFFELLDRKLEKTRKLLFAQRTLLKKRIDNGFLKFFTIGWMTLNRFFSTVGFNGLYESLKFLNYDITTREGIGFAKKIFKHIEKKLDTFSKQDVVAYNLEQIPAEGVASTFAKMDKIYFKDDEYPYQLYANQFVPLTLNCDLIERAKIDGEICKLASGGSICHLNIGCEATPQQMRDLINFAVQCGLEHFALNASFNTCENEHVTLGKSTDTNCPICKSKIVNNMTRVVGYFTPVQDWDKVRRDVDYPNRKFNYLDDILVEQQFA